MSEHDGHGFWTRHDLLIMLLVVITFLAIATSTKGPRVYAPTPFPPPARSTP